MYNHCKTSMVQEYKCTVWKHTPFSQDKSICFDMCLASELIHLWNIGIITTGCCCGKHNNSLDNSSFIGVLPEFIPKMKELGYTVRFNSCRPDDEDSFIPKSLK